MFYKFIIVSIILLLIDFTYLSLINKYFQKQIFNIQKSYIKLDIFATILCYMALIVGLNYFIIKEKKNIYEAFLLGFIIYIVFETTNKALFKNWTWITVLIDGVWGGLLFLLTTLISYKIFKTLKLK